MWKGKVIILVLACLTFIAAEACPQVQSREQEKLRLALEYERVGNFERAAELFRNLYQIQPNNQA